LNSISKIKLSKNLEIQHEYNEGESMATSARSNEFHNTDLEQGLSKLQNESYEGKTTRTVEKITSKIPSLNYLALAIASMGVSAALAVTKKHELASFVGRLAPSLLIMGVYNKIVKVEQSLSQQCSSQQTSAF
jgi:hypothetical protein